MAKYEPGIPTGTVNLNEDYKNIQNNFSQLDTTFGIDHLPFSSTSSKLGYHRVIHSVPFSTTVTNPPNNYPPVAPTTVPDVGQIFTAIVNDGFNTDSALFYRTASSAVMQLTSNKQPHAGNNGYTFIPGGLLVQWGQITNVTDVFTQLTFSTNNIAFPNHCYAIFTQPYGTNVVPSNEEQCTIQIDFSSINNLGFKWVTQTNSGRYTGFFWIAIGN